MLSANHRYQIPILSLAKGAINILVDPPQEKYDIFNDAGLFHAEYCGSCCYSWPGGRYGNTE